jgi:hypothetical protein
MPAFRSVVSGSHTAVIVEPASRSTTALDEAHRAFQVPLTGCEF